MQVDTSIQLDGPNDAYVNLLLDGKEYGSRIRCALVFNVAHGKWGCDRSFDLPVLRTAHRAEVVFFEDWTGDKWIVRIPIDQSPSEGTWIHVSDANS